MSFYCQLYTYSYFSFSATLSNECGIPVLVQPLPLQTEKCFSNILGDQDQKTKQKKKKSLEI